MRDSEAGDISNFAAQKNERPVPVPGRALGVLYSDLHGTVWHPYAGER